MAETKCRNCDADLKGARFCPECGADSEAKRFSRENDLLAENTRLKSEIEELKKPKPAAPGGSDVNDI